MPEERLILQLFMKKDTGAKERCLYEVANLNILYIVIDRRSNWSRWCWYNCKKSIEKASDRSEDSIFQDYCIGIGCE